MINAIRVHEHGGPEKLVWEAIPKPEPKPGEALVRHEAVGLNYIDVYFRTGLYKAPSMPVTIGMEGAGVVDALGEGRSRDKAARKQVPHANTTGKGARQPGALRGEPHLSSETHHLCRVHCVAIARPARPSFLKTTQTHPTPTTPYLLNIIWDLLDVRSH